MRKPRPHEFTGPEKIRFVRLIQQGQKLSEQVPVLCFNHGGQNELLFDLGVEVHFHELGKGPAEVAQVVCIVEIPTFHLGNDVENPPTVAHRIGFVDVVAVEEPVARPGRHRVSLCTLFWDFGFKGECPGKSLELVTDKGLVGFECQCATTDVFIQC